MRLGVMIAIAGLSSSACGGGPPEPESPVISPESVPSLSLLGDVQRGDASDSGDGPSCSKVIDEERRRAGRGEVSGEEPTEELRSEIKALLNTGEFLGRCEVPETSRVEVCAAIIDGRARGVTVTIEPGSPDQASCVANAIRAIAFPSHPLVDVARTSFERL